MGKDLKVREGSAVEGDERCAHLGIEEGLGCDRVAADGGDGAALQWPNEVGQQRVDRAVLAQRVHCAPNHTTSTSEHRPSNPLAVHSIHRAQPRPHLTWPWHPPAQESFWKLR